MSAIPVVDLLRAYLDPRKPAALRREARAALGVHIEALEEDRERLSWPLAQFQMMSPKIDGQHAWVMRDTLRRGPTALAALDAMRAGRL